MEGDIGKINESKDWVCTAIHQVMQKAKSSLPDMCEDAYKQPAMLYGKSYHTRLFFKDGNTIECQKFAGLIFSLLQEELPHTKLAVSAKEPFSEPYFLFHRDDLRKFSPHKTDELSKKLGELLMLSNNEFKEKIESVDLSSVLSSANAGIAQMDSDERVNMATRSFFGDLKRFIEKANIRCQVEHKIADDEIVWMFKSNDSDMIKLAGTVANKLECLGAVTLEFDKDNVHQCSIVFHKEEFAKSAPANLLYIKSKFRVPASTESSESLRAQIDAFKPEEHFHLLMGVPAPRKRLV